MTTTSSQSQSQTSNPVAPRSGMLSRVANLIYWTARYLERAENTARLIDVNAQLVLDLDAQQDSDDPRAWEPLVYVTGDEKDFVKLYGETTDERNVVEYLLFDRRNTSSFVSCIFAARENARCIQDQIASEMWETLNTFYLELKQHDYESYTQFGPSEYLSQLKLRIQQLYGVAESMLPRDEGWWFYQLGRYLERADNVSRIIDIKYYMILPPNHQVGAALDIVQWASVLRSCSAFEAFRRSKRGQLTLTRVLDYLIRDRAFPRSLLSAIIAAENCVRQIIADADTTANAKHTFEQLGKLRAHLEQTDIDAVIASGLHEYLDQFQVKIIGIHTDVGRAFLQSEYEEVATA
ncbi:alpha-E domain-containing protein [Synoicihabitans lomoniglobus]|uniref:Alpha-E domain-containing protein n=1 Tax=Synoicihabitans lomoniglobus TaxID=2909285 RepID=A0AAE9ZT79_9BACT|nr:alpha-E domain-containing protein [Opitutaceae bacterium LMO-M01]WED64755.1 alpha-E domain-containing protein [Opitutaceae bacterium LMO-M01]